MKSRRDFLAGLAALPFVGCFLPKVDVSAMVGHVEGGIAPKYIVQRDIRPRFAPERTRHICRVFARLTAGLNLRNTLERPYTDGHWQYIQLTLNFVNGKPYPYYDEQYYMLTGMAYPTGRQDEIVFLLEAHEDVDRVLTIADMRKDWGWCQPDVLHIDYIVSDDTMYAPNGTFDRERLKCADGNGVVWWEAQAWTPICQSNGIRNGYDCSTYITAANVFALKNINTQACDTRNATMFDMIKKSKLL